MSDNDSRKEAFKVIKERSSETKSHGSAWDKKNGTLVVKGSKFKGEAEDVEKAIKEGHRNRRSASIFVSTGNKSGREAYKEFLKYENTLNPHYRVDRETKEAVKKEIRRVERNHKIKKSIALGTVALGTTVGVGVAAKKIHNKKKEN